MIIRTTLPILVSLVLTLVGCSPKDSAPVTGKETAAPAAGGQAQNQTDLKTVIAKNESSAVGAMRVVSTAEVAFQSAKGTYGSLADLGSAEPAFIDSVLASGKKNGYVFTVTPTGNKYTCTASPLEPGRTGVRCFFVDESGVIRQSTDGKAPSASSPPIQ